ncbi:hypothetical protein C1646_813951 [Rhizophagus diaphanus]|nr:hypothetical protein C1646_813951 [Rhizophagus diaphanus] [Rhizophagus sp. MUCL 43196]
MSCSKIFSGDLPELTYDIIKYLQNDFSTLHSCILVNRLWCRLAIPLLWKDPFSISTENYNFIEIYLHNLNGDFKTKLNEYGIDKLLPSNTLFNYPSFIKYLNTHKLIFSVEKWFESLKLREFILNSETDFKRLVYKSLFKIIINNEVKLHTFEIEFIIRSFHDPYLNDILELILQNTKNTNFIHNIGNLNLHTIDYDNNHSLIIKNHILQIIELHQNLKKIILSYQNFPLYKSLLLSKDFNFSNTLNTIIFYGINFENMINLDKIFGQLNVLESVHILYCCNLNNNFIQQIINLTEPFKIKSLFIKDVSQVESLQLLLQKFGVYLENFGYRTYSNQSQRELLLKCITKYCKNIKFFDLNESNNQTIHPILDLFGNMKQSLNYLSINILLTLSSNSKNSNNDCSSFLLQNLGQILPSRLEYLSYTLHIKKKEFGLFLKSIQNIFINKLTICNREGDDILYYIKKYIMNKKRVKYLAFKNIYDIYDSSYDTDLFDMKGEVNVFRLHNIKVQSYSDLNIEFYDYVKKTY